MPDTRSAFTGFGFPNLNNKDEVAFFASSDTSAGVFVIERRGLRPIAHIGQRIPDGTPRETFTSFWRTSEIENAAVLFNNSGKVAFRADFGGGEGLFLYTRRIARTCARTGTLVPGTHDGSTFDEFSLPVLNRSGMIAFHAKFGSLSGIFARRRHGLRAIARTGQSVRGKTFTRFSRPGLNNAGHVVFNASFQNTQGNGVFLNSRRRLVPLILPGDELPDDNSVSFVSATRPAVNESGAAIFEAFFENDEGGIEALVLTSEDSTKVLDRQKAGEPTLLDLVLNANGETAYVLSDFESSLFVTQSQEPQLVAGGGAPVPATFGDVRYIERVDLLSGDGGDFVFAGKEDGLPGGFNNKGEVAFVARPAAKAGEAPRDAIVVARPNGIPIS